ncbi:class I SAM-dependent methyltransferase [Stappia sp. MMSF_3263]|uniref:class I SAM-dependent methyltransferase n=1 Tax=Stappia sp. MMSF_3263 TaxID=3046693 RepID=UPI00273E39C3|nr:class I SAM-dependent methyltransferase [Stappia sp. MMSF_3263]
MKTSTEDSNNRFLKSFQDPQAVADYVDGPRRYVPGLADLHRMTGLLLAERAPEDARVLVLGAGGGLELKALSDAHPGWRFVGVDPAEPMLDLAREVLGPSMTRIELVQGYIDDAPQGPFDAAVCLLTLHFLSPDERRRTAGEIHHRLKPGAPFVAAHCSFPQGAEERRTWLSRYAAFALASGADPEQVGAARAAIEASEMTLDPGHDEELLREAGFADASLFYAAFTWRGWTAHA